MLEVTAQPVWVVDRDGVIRFANPAALEALGYRADELLGCHSHATVHHSRADGTPYPREECTILAPLETGGATSSDLDWYFRKDGSKFPIAFVSVPFDMPDGRGAVVAFTDIEERLHDEREMLAREADLEGQQAALRRVATLVAGGADAYEVLATVAREVGQVLGMPLVQILRYEADDTLTVMAGWSEPNPFVPGTRWPRSPGTIADAVYRTRERARIDDLAAAQGAFADQAKNVSKVRAGAGAPILIGGELWGVMGAATPEGQRLAPGLEDRLAEFTDLLATAIADTASREELSRLAGEQAALRRVATLVAEGAPADEVRAAVTRAVRELDGVDADTWPDAFSELVATAIANMEARAEVRRLADEQAALRRVATMVARGESLDALAAAVTAEVGALVGADLAGLARYDPGNMVQGLATWAAGGEHPQIPMAVPLDRTGVVAMVARSGRPERVDDWSEIDSETAVTVHKLGVRATVATPITVDGGLWGVVVLHSKAGPLPADTDARAAHFTDLLSTALANAQARSDVGRLADEQAALRRVATLAAHEASPDEVFHAGAEELRRLLAVDDIRMVRYEPGDLATVVGSISSLGEIAPVGTRLALGGTNIITRVHRTAQPARVEDYAQATGRAADYAREIGARSSVGVPIVVQGGLWGCMLATSGSGPLAPETEARTVEFTELVATAIANVEARGELAASRARVVATADEERRRVVRDLHDGAQQRLVHTVVTLKLAARALTGDRDGARRMLRDALEQAETANAELRELAQGILPAVLTRGGLRAGAEALASRSPVPVRIDVPAVRLPAPVEATGYFVIAEALTNVAKHSHAESASVCVRMDDRMLHVEVRDDGVGGADSAGTGLIGLCDRVAALRGDMRVHSPRGAGTVVAATIPLERASS